MDGSSGPDLSMGGIQGLRVERGLGCYTFCSQKSWVVISPRSGHWIQIEAVETIKLAAKQHGLDISGGIIRRTSSRFCLGVEHGDYNGMELFGVGTDRFIWMGYRFEYFLSCSISLVPVGFISCRISLHDFSCTISGRSIRPVGKLLDHPVGECYISYYPILIPIYFDDFMIFPFH